MSPAKTTPAAESLGEIANLAIDLKDTDPVIWRQVEAPTSITLKVLHDIVQATIGWFDYHLWEFTIGKQRYGLPMDEDWWTIPRKEAAKVRLREVLGPRKTVIDYIYDFGDSWEHWITVTNVRPGDPQVSYPRYIGGAGNGPPEAAAVSLASMKCWKPGPIRIIPATPKPSNGWMTTTPTPLTRSR